MGFWGWTFVWIVILVANFVPSLKLKAKASEKWWLEDEVAFLGEEGLWFSRAFAVSFRPCNFVNPFHQNCLPPPTHLPTTSHPQRFPGSRFHALGGRIFFIIKGLGIDLGLGSETHWWKPSGGQEWFVTKRQLGGNASKILVKNEVATKPWCFFWLAMFFSGDMSICWCKELPVNICLKVSIDCSLQFNGY